MKVKNVVKCVLFPVLLSMTLGLMNHYVFSRQPFTENSVTNYVKEEENSLDGTFLGSSTVWYGIIPTEIWKQSGLTSRVIAKAPFHPGLNLDTLEFVYRKQEKSLKFVYVDLVSYFTLSDDNVHDFLVDYYYSFPRDSEERRNLIYKYPFLESYQEENRDLDEKLFEGHNDYRRNDFWQTFANEDRNFTKGFYPQNYGYACDKLAIPDCEPISLKTKNPDGFKYLFDVLSFADKHPETKFIFARTARKLCDQEETEVDTFVFKWVQNYIKNERPKEVKGARTDYIVKDFALDADEIGIDEKTDLRDPAHLNVKGAIKNTKYLSKFLKENIDVSKIKHSEKVEEDFENCYKKTEEYLKHILKNNIRH